MIIWTWEQLDDLIELYEAIECLTALRTYEAKCKRCKEIKQFHAVSSIMDFAHNHLHGENNPLIEVIVEEEERTEEEPLENAL